MKFLFPAFVLVVLAQLFVPAKMIFDKEDVIKNGQEFKFKTVPVDPLDPMRGKYVALRFEQIRTNIDNPEDWKGTGKVYVQIENDRQGFAQIKSATKELPNNDEPYLIASLQYLNVEARQITITYPFDRFYMEESKAYAAEQLYRRRMQEGGSDAYALVSLGRGDAVLKDVMIGDTSLRDLVIAERLRAQ